MGNLLSGPEFAATVVQASSVHFDTPATLEKCEKMLEEAAQKLSRLVVFPEAFVGGYPRGSNFGATIGNRTHKGQSQLLRYHASAINVPGPEVEQLAAMAGKYRVYLIMGVIERDGYTLYSTALFFDCQGRYLGKQRKVTPTALERTIWGLGDGTIPVFKTELGKIGAAISWDNRMPLLRTAMYAKGVQIYCAPTTDASKEWLASMTHIALEGGCYVLSANQFCRRKDYPSDYESSLATEIKDLKPDSVVCAGGSVIISPSGQILQGPNHVGEVLLTANIDLNEIARAKLDFDVVGHSSRPEILSLVARNNPAKPVTFTSGSEKTEEFHK